MSINFLNRGRSSLSSQCLYVFLVLDDICLGLIGFCLYFYVKRYLLIVLLDFRACLVSCPPLVLRWEWQLFESYTHNLINSKLVGTRQTSYHRIVAYPLWGFLIYLTGISGRSTRQVPGYLRL